MPAAPKVANKALSSNSPTTRGLMFSRSNQASMRGRTAECAVGNNTGKSAKHCGKLFLGCS